MLDDCDISSTRHARAFVAGALASLVGHAEIFVSGGAEHQGPDGGGPVAIIADAGRRTAAMSAALDTIAIGPERTRARRLETIGMTKLFGSLMALDDVSIKVRAGTLHALLGENGAGKSTLVKCIMGFYQPTRGTVLVDGHEIDIRNPRDAHAHGIGMVYQHFTLVPSLTAAENLVISRARIRRPIIDWRKEKRRRSSAFLDTHAVPRAARRAGLGARGRREAEARDPEAALSRPALPDPRRADLGADARRGRRGARPPHAA